MRLKRPRRPRPPESERLPLHPVTVRVSLTTGECIVEGLDPQIRSIVANLSAGGIDLIVESRGLCG